MLPGDGSGDSPPPTPDQKPINPITDNSGHQQKRAVLCGVSYRKEAYKLEGPVNDVKNMKSLLVKFGFPEHAICVLTEEQNDPNLTPTKENMKKALSWLVDRCISGDSLVFYFSGHGFRVNDTSNDESDDYDEVLCPTNFMTAGIILDDDINATIVRPLKEGVKLHAIVDCCYSGTVLDLKYVYDTKEREWKENQPSSGVDKGTEGGLAISFTACADDERAVDTTAFSSEMGGALTSTFIEACKENSGITYGQLLSEMNALKEDAFSKGCFSTLFLKKLFHRKLQKFQLSSSECFDVDKEEFKL
ncbi:hypothetical protein NMG60_11021437 [Bertholletia excelsa]